MLQLKKAAEELAITLQDLADLDATKMYTKPLRTDVCR
jgi:hypothetical protein